MDGKCVGIIAEYNPFHNGHLYHLKQSVSMTGAEVAVAAMSGNFVQRGQMAVRDKWERAEAAVRGGADLVVEIPTVFACSSAPVFAAAAVEILENLGADWISFGSESGNMEELREISRGITDNERDLGNAIKEKVKEGLSYPRARKEAVSVIFGDKKAALLDLPNNILAAEYLKNIRRAEAVTVKRFGPGYNDREIICGMASASAIREKLRTEERVDDLVPEASSVMLKKDGGPSEDLIFRMICQKAFSLSAERLDSVFAGGEGLGNKLKKAVRRAASLDELAEQLKSKRYTRTRIDRFLMHVLLEIGDPRSYGNFIRVLAFSSKGGAYLKEVKKREISSLPVITNINKEVFASKGLAVGKFLAAVEKDILASDLYNLASKRNLYDNSEYVKKPFVLGERQNFG